MQLQFKICQKVVVLSEDELKNVTQGHGIIISKKNKNNEYLVDVEEVGAILIKEEDIFDID